MASVAVFGLSACKASKEGEIKTWTANATSVTSLSTEYPQFAALLKARVTAQQKIFDAAKAEKGDDAAKKMEQANKSVHVLLGPLEKYKSKRARIKKLYNDYSVRKNKGHKVRSAREKADKKLQQASELIAAAQPTNDAEMLKTLADANGYLSEGLQPLERLKKKGSKSKRKKKKRS